MRYWLTLSVLSLFVIAGCENDKSDEKAKDSSDVASQPTQKESRDTGDDTKSDRETSEPSADRTKSNSEMPAKAQKATTSRAGTVSESPPLNIKKALSIEKIKKKMGDSVNVSPLEGIPVSPEYDSLRLTRPNQTGFGWGLQLWELQSPEKAAERFGRMKKQSLNVTPYQIDSKTELEESYRASRSGVTQIVFRLKKYPYIVGFSCAQKSCPDRETQMGLISLLAEDLKT